MSILPNRRPLFAFMALTITSTPAAAQQTPADAAQIVEAIEACRAITSPKWIELKALPALGWDNAERRASRGRQIMRGIYEKAGNNAYVIVGKDELDSKSCVVTARLASGAEYGPTAQGVAELIGMPERAEGHTYFWTLGDKRIRLDPAGERDAPLARFEITAIPTESAK